MDGPRQKRIRSLALRGDARAKHIQYLLHTGGISIKGLAAISQKVQVAGPQALSNTALYEANLARFLHVRHIVSVPMLNGANDFQWELAHPCRLLSLMLADCPGLERLFLAAVARHPCAANRRWRVVIGFDEYVPGNKLQVLNQRKCI